MLYIPTPGCEDSLSIRAGWGVGEHYGGSSKVFPQAARWGTGRGLTSASSRRICRTFPVALHGSSFTRLQMGKRSQLLQLNFQRYSLLQQILEKKRRKKNTKLWWWVNRLVMAINLPFTANNVMQSYGELGSRTPFRVSELGSPTCRGTFFDLSCSEVRNSEIWAFRGGGGTLPHFWGNAS